MTVLVVVAVIPVKGFDWGRYIGTGDINGAPVGCFKHVSNAQLKHSKGLLMKRDSVWKSEHVDTANMVYLN